MLLINSSINGKTLSEASLTKIIFLFSKSDLFNTSFKSKSELANTSS